jgi:hypothetical protein
LKDETGDDTYMVIEKADADDGGLIWHNGAQSAGTIDAAVALTSNENLTIENRLTDKDIIFELNDGGTADTELIRLDASTLRVGIGTATPSKKLHLKDGDFYVDRSASTDEALIKMESNGLSTGTTRATTLKMKHDDIYWAYHVKRDNDNYRVEYFNGTSSVMPLTITPDAPGDALFVDGASGVAKVGIGTNSPGYMLDVQGGDINASGDVRAATVALFSDQMFKTNIDSIESALSIIDELQPRTYYFDTINFNGEGKFDFASAKQYGFIAQDVEDILPELVSIGTKPAIEDSLGNVVLDSYTYRALNYVGVIPILTKGIQELKFVNDSLTSNIDNMQIQIDQLVEAGASMGDQVQQLFSIIDLCCNSSDGSFRMSGTDGGDSEQIEVTLKDVQSIVLEQNVPNPFAERTVINYFIPMAATKAEILFHNSLGQQIRNVNISDMGKGQINVFANDLSSGIYSYSLVIDGRIVESMQMIKSD